MSVYSEIREKLEGFKASGGGANIGGLMIAEVKSVEGDTCTIAVDDDLDLSDVRLRVVGDDNTSSKMLLTPKIGSFVLVADLSGGDLSDMAVIMFSEVTDVMFNGGNNGGLINIESLTAKINNLVGSVNSLVNAFNSHTHTVSTTGSATAQSGTAAPTETQVQTADQLNQAEFEDTKIKH